MNDIFKFQLLTFNLIEFLYNSSPNVPSSKNQQKLDPKSSKLERRRVRRRFLHKLTKEEGRRGSRCRNQEGEGEERCRLGEGASFMSLYNFLTRFRSN